MSCPYRDIFGKPNTGAHSYRFFNFAIVDVILTFIVAFLLAKYSRFKSIIKNFIFLMVLAIILHRLFCVNTTLNMMIFGKV